MNIFSYIFNMLSIFVVNEYFQMKAQEQFRISELVRQCFIIEWIHIVNDSAN